MCKYIFLLPLYNDWESFSLLLEKISKELSTIEKEAEILLVNDFSNIKPPKFKKYENITKIRILNLKENLGSQKAISIGLAYLKNLEEEMIITVLDSDGEDDVKKIPIMIENAEKNRNRVVVSTRAKRQENFFFKLAYSAHKILTLFLTFKWISFGNFSSFSSIQLEKILSNSSSWLAISSCVARNCNILKIEAERKKRLIGISKLSYIGLISHSLRVIAVFILRSLTTSFFYIIILIIFFGLSSNYIKFLICAIIFFNLLLVLIILKNKQIKFQTSQDLISEIIDQ